MHLLSFTVQALATQSSWWQCAAAEIFNSSEGQMTNQQFYPIGTPGKPWTGTEKQIWQQRQTRVRSYKNDVLDALQALIKRYDIGKRTA
ncbi:hypothetical protein [Escherichia sp. MOD1-EC7003]|uniref:hypothetical protein n=1 Tax=Escherichia sp. MOD1-EC7003 TaxID=2093900 RepID=UPI001F546A8D|nr:hypothetical protein [Escherichia sp. MOD1-EC7003]